MYVCVDPNQYSWGENYAGSSGLMSVSPEMNPVQRARSGTVSHAISVASLVKCRMCLNKKKSLLLGL